MSEPIRKVLLLEPDERDARTVLAALGQARRPRFEVRRETGPEAERQAVVPADIDVVLLGLGEDIEAGLATLRALRRRTGEVPILALSGVEDEALGLQLVKEGAQDWLPKSEVTPGSVARAIRYAIERERACTLRPEPDERAAGRSGIADAVARAPTQLRPSRPPPASDARSSPPASRPPSERPAARPGSRPPPATDDILRRYLVDSAATDAPAPPRPDTSPPTEPGKIAGRAAQPAGSSPPPGAGEPGWAAAFGLPPVEVGGLLDGKYRLLRRIAQGGLGEIYEARHEVIGHRVAVKMIRAAFSGDPEISVRFLQEARAASAIGHPGCVRVFDFGVSPEGRAYLVMELLEGESTWEHLQREHRLPLREAAEIAGETLEVLAATHVRGIIHRDLKPENIFLARGPHGERLVKLLDFGIARLTADAVPDDGRLTRPGMMMGTPHYMAPEQALGTLDADLRVDLYAVGVLLFETTTGRVPFEGSTNQAILAQVLTAPFPSPRALEPSLPEAFDALVRRATERDPAARFASAEEFLAALQPFLA